ncbi:MAG TPA: hypothetical protein PKE07_06150 [Lacibacter sp.]|nr:hypothetical protein [Lacibacter sp.]HMO89110.1 hypothetical protein [Lacibacter sp.]
MRILFPACLALFLYLLSACSAPRTILREQAQFDTLRLALDLKLVQQPEYRELLVQKTQRFVEVFNTETHPFRLAFTEADADNDLRLRLLRSRFINTRQSHVAAGVTAAGIGTAVYLLQSGFFIPVGWVYLPNAKTSLEPVLSQRVTGLTDFPAITISSSGFYRPLDKQMERQATKVLQYLVQIVLQLEREYLAQKVQ